MLTRQGGYRDWFNRTESSFQSLWAQFVCKSRATGGARVYLRTQRCCHDAVSRLWSKWFWSSPRPLISLGAVMTTVRSLPVVVHLSEWVFSLRFRRVLPKDYLSHVVIKRVPVRVWTRLSVSLDHAHFQRYGTNLVRVRKLR